MTWLLVTFCEIPVGSPPMRALNTGGVYKFRDFLPISGYMYKTYKIGRVIVTMERYRIYAFYRTVTFPITLNDL